jgi:acetyltransferase
MSTRNLRYFLEPASIVLVGASDQPGTVGYVAARNLLESEFSGNIYFVDSGKASILGKITLAHVDDLPEAPGLAVIAAPSESVPDTLKALGEQGTRAAVVLASDIRDHGPERIAEIQTAMQQAARPYRMRITGPESLGVISTRQQINASFIPFTPPPGRLAFIAESGATLTAAVDWAGNHGIGFSHLISLGDKCDSDFGDWLDYLATDPGTSAILIYLRDITEARKFMSAARSAARQKPVIVFRGGRFPQPANEAHITPYPLKDAIYDGAFRRAGALRIDSFDAFFEVVNTLARARFRGARLALLTNSYNAGLLARDAVLSREGQLAALSDETIQALELVLTGRRRTINPLNLRFDAGGQRYEQALSILLSAREVDAIVVVHCPSALASSTEAADAVIRAAEGHRNVLVNWLGGPSVREAQARFAGAGIPSYDTPGQAIDAFMHVIEFQRNQRQLMETPASIPRISTETRRVQGIIDTALNQEDAWLGEADAKHLLTAYGIGVVETRRAEDADTVYRVARTINAPVAVKIDSPDVGHKGNVGGVTLHLDTADSAREAARAMAHRLGRLCPDARLSGFIVQPLIRDQGQHELLAGIGSDPVFGPVVYFGHGGEAIKERADIAAALPPLNMNLARDLMAQTRIYKLLAGADDLPACDLDALALVLIQLGQLAVDFPEIREIRINPLLASPSGTLALDASVKLAPAAQAAQPRLAIRPYPKEVEQDFTLSDGRAMRLRPILPEDEPSLIQAFEQLPQEARYYRFFSPLPEMPHAMAARLSQIDYDREMAWVLTEPDTKGDNPIFGVARLIAEPDFDRAEYALVVLPDLAGHGVGTRMMEILLDYARARGIGEVQGEVLSENRAMLGICKKLGFATRFHPQDKSIVQVRMALN